MTLNKTLKSFSILFFLIVLTEQLTAANSNLLWAHYIAKPAIVGSLIILLFKTSGYLPSGLSRLTLSGLIFSLIGDFLLMFVETSELFFIAGLIAFLIAHCFYIIVFLKGRNSTQKRVLPLIILLVYAIVFLGFIYKSLGSLLIPVILYVIVILGMAYSSFLRKDSVSACSYVFVMIGALFFVISDSLLAIDKFYQPIPMSNLGIMITYAIAQFLIIIGILKTKSVTTS